MPGFGSPAVGAAAVALVFILFGSMQASQGSDGLAHTSASREGAKAEKMQRSFVLTAADNAHFRDNDYPTATRADYVMGCMAANGNTREALLKCSCAIDTIAGLMPYSHYEEAETALSLQLGGGVGGRVGLFRDPPQIRAVIEELRRAQAEANLQCR